MASWLRFDLEQNDIDKIVSELDVTPRQVKLSIVRSLSRTATTLRKMAASGLKSELELRTISLLRKRLKSIKLRSSRNDGVKIWFGLNTIPVSWWKGRPVNVVGGAQARGVKFDGAFVARSKFKNRLTILKRKSGQRLPLEEQQLPIDDKAKVYIEDKIFVQIEEIFFRHFERDIRARVKYNLGLS